ARGDAPMARQRQLEPAAEAEAVDAAHHRNRQALEPVEVAVHLRDAVGHLALVSELLELPHVGADDEPLLLAGNDDEPADRLVARALIDALYDHGQLFERPSAE